MDREAWRAAVHGITKSRTWLSDWTKLNWVLHSVLLGLILLKNTPTSVPQASATYMGKFLHFFGKWAVSSLLRLCNWHSERCWVITSYESIGNKGTWGVGSEKAMAPHSSTLAWKIPWMEEPGRLQSMGSRRVRHNWATSLSLFTFMHWRRKWQPTPVFSPGESQGQGSLVGCHLWGHTELDTTEVT